ncbi:unnamed protein product [Didymodactylos carnosus]|uniref:Uncharacterized protein n=1 Tax=Didymodactylos carnosus TaxID=1234261 RepID=A0A815KI04_9BILA|nr:unnamed protein product [Didymodactylos carnosus]CAF1391361.1 unnamed protein product [Didymodactylos carnosus]CAF3598164.1 unnamed protein product [Didymodactylos carnosus]CAF4285906.1 unnamed protein product [Didymodactylos carnosus]
MNLSSKLVNRHEQTELLKQENIIYCKSTCNFTRKFDEFEIETECEREIGFSYCSLKILLDYRSQAFMVSFLSNASDTINDDNLIHEVVTSLIFDETSADRVWVTYECNTNDCDIQYTNWFIDKMSKSSSVQMSLKSQLSRILIDKDENDELECYVSEVSETLPCHGIACYAVGKDDETYFAECYEMGSDKYNMQILIETTKDGTTVQYLCNINDCNDEDRFQNVIKIIKDINILSFLFTKPNNTTITTPSIIQTVDHITSGSNSYVTLSDKQYTTEIKPDENKVTTTFGRTTDQTTPENKNSNTNIYLRKTCSISALLVANYGKYEVRRYRIGDTEGTVVAGGNGSGNRLDQLSTPWYVFVDRDHAMYVSDHDNHRVMKCEGTKQDIVVAGGKGQ